MRTVEGQRIELEDRRNYTYRSAVSLSNNWKDVENSTSDDESDQSDFYTSQIYHKFARPRLSNDKQEKINVKHLELPVLFTSSANNVNNLKVKKRNKLGLKPLKLLTVKPKQELNVAKKEIKLELDPLDNLPHDHDDDIKDSKPNYDINDVDFDFDVLRLIIRKEESNHATIYNQLHSHTDNNKMETQRRRAADDRLKSKHTKKGRKIRFTLSKPASPRTVQVIRVNVTAQLDSDGHHLCNEEIADEDDYCARFRRAYGLAGKCDADDAQRDIDDELQVLCTKLTLSRKD